MSILKANLEIKLRQKNGLSESTAIAAAECICSLEHMWVLRVSAESMVSSESLLTSYHPFVQ